MTIYAGSITVGLISNASLPSNSFIPFQIDYDTYKITWDQDVPAPLNNLTIPEFIKLLTDKELKYGMVNTYHYLFNATQNFTNSAQPYIITSTGLLSNGIITNVIRKELVHDIGLQTSGTITYNDDISGPVDYLPTTVSLSSDRVCANNDVGCPFTQPFVQKLQFKLSFVATVECTIPNDIVCPNVEENFAKKYWWIWLIIGLLILIGFIILIVYLVKRKKNVTTKIQTRNLI